MPIVVSAIPLRMNIFIRSAGRNTSPGDNIAQMKHSSTVAHNVLVMVLVLAAVDVADLCVALGEVAVFDDDFLRERGGGEDRYEEHEGGEGVHFV